MRFRRLYVAGYGDSFRYCITTSKQKACELLEDEAARVPDPDDIRAFWLKSGIGQMSMKEVRQAFGVTRQALDLWHLKGGRDLPRRKDHMKEVRRAKALDAVQKNPNISAHRLAEQIGISKDVIARAAQELEVTLPKRKQGMPTDAELVALGTGRTWRELAEAVGVRLATVRTYVYRRPKLAKALSKVRKAMPRGAAAKGRIPIQKIRELGDQGLTAYAIGEVLGIEQMTVRAHLRKWRKEQEHEVRESADE